MAKTYKCTNYGICTEADKETIFQETDLEEVDGKFVCPKCGQELEEIRKGPGVNWKLICVIAAVLMAAGVAVYFTCFKGKGSGGNDPAAGQVDTSIAKPQADQPVKIVDEPELEGEESDLDTKESKESEKDVQPAKPKIFSLGWGTYDGPMQNGKPHGLGGEVTVTKSYSIDLKNGSYKQVVKGDKLINTKFKEGKLVQGYIHHANGEQESFVIGY